MQKIEKAKELADKIEKHSYMKSFTQDELSEMKDNLTDESIELRTLKNELKEISKTYKEKMKPIKNAISGLLDNLHQKAQMITEDCFVELEHYSGKANYYSPSSGELVYSRPLVASEMQKTLRMDANTDNKKTGTNN